MNLVKQSEFEIGEKVFISVGLEPGFIYRTNRGYIFGAVLSDVEVRLLENIWIFVEWNGEKVPSRFSQVSPK